MLQNCCSICVHTHQLHVCGQLGHPFTVLARQRPLLRPGQCRTIPGTPPGWAAQNHITPGQDRAARRPQPSAVLPPVRQWPHLRPFCFQPRSMSRSMPRTNFCLAAAGQKGLRLTTSRLLATCDAIGWSAGSAAATIASRLCSSVCDT